MPRMIILSLALIAILGFAGLAIESTTIAASATTTQPVCQADPTNPDPYEIVLGKHARPGSCVVIQATDESFSIVTIRTTVLRDWLSTSENVRIWMNFDSIDSARQFACNLVKSSPQVHPGYLVSTDIRCFSLRIGGVVRQ